VTEQELQEFTPATPTEFALNNEIKRLRKENYLLRIEANMHPQVTNKPYEINQAVLDMPPKITLYEGADLIANVEPDGNVRVMQRGYSKDGQTFGAGYYVSALEARTTTADLMHELHKRNLRVLGSFIYNGGKR
jgi:hypothetical protein